MIGDGQIRRKAPSLLSIYMSSGNTGFTVLLKTILSCCFVCVCLFAYVGLQGSCMSSEKGSYERPAMVHGQKNVPCTDGLFKCCVADRNIYLMYEDE